MILQQKEKGVLMKKVMSLFLISVSWAFTAVVSSPNYDCFTALNGNFKPSKMNVSLSDGMLMIAYTVDNEKNGITMQQPAAIKFVRSIVYVLTQNYTSTVCIDTIPATLTLMTSTETLYMSILAYDCPLNALKIYGVDTLEIFVPRNVTVKNTANPSDIRTINLYGIMIPVESLKKIAEWIQSLSI
jgi:hypothetical protein